MKIKDIVNFEKFYMNIADSTLPLMTAYKLNNIYLAVKNDLDFYKAQAQKTLVDCAQFNEDGSVKYNEDKTQIILKQDKIEEFNQRYNELANMECEFDDNLRIDIGLFPDTLITPAELMSIHNFIK